MSILIKDMKMPINCTRCPCSDEEARFCWAKTEYIPMLGKPDWCPLVELPEKHGDLIDRTTLLKEFELAQKSADMHGREFANAFYSSGNEISTEWWAVEELVENAIAVIEAEGEE